MHSNGVAGSLPGIPAAVRRYDAINIAGATVGTLGTIGVVIAIWLGWGLLGAVGAQLLSSVVAVIGFASIGWRLVKKLPVSERSIKVDRLLIKRILPFSGFLSGGQTMSMIGLQMDRTLDRALVGMLLGTSVLGQWELL